MLPVGFGSQETQNQVAGALGSQCLLGFSLLDPGSQVAGLLGLQEERTDDKELCVGHRQGGRWRKLM